MKILITGYKSYIGMSFKKWLDQWPDKYNVELLSLRNNEWKNKDFSQFDVLFHVAALVHTKERYELKSCYYKINRDLTIEVAKKAKKSGIKQFIFMSTASVYGLIGTFDQNIVITKDTPCIPTTFYGKSKLQAEKELEKLNDLNFHIAVIRAPIVYGPHCPGNYDRLRKFVMKVPIFPLINNQRSMIFIDNLSEFIRFLVDNKLHGLFFPQNKEYINISELVRLIAKENSKLIYFSETLAFGVKIIGKRINVLNKVFGNLVFDKELSLYKDVDYCVADLSISVKICENKK